MIIVKFSDGEIVQGGGWNSLPHKPIQKVALLIDGRKVVMQGFDSYNHLQEHVYNVTGNSLQIRSIYLMGRSNNLVNVVRYNLITKQFEETLAGFGLEYNGRPCTGWKNGFSDLTPTYKIF